MIILPAQCRQALRAACEVEFPREACGLLVGTPRGDGARLVVEVVPGRNVHPGGGRDRFTLDPADFIRADAVASARGLDIVGTFHSHAGGPAEPSGLDAEHAQPGWSHVIVAVEAGRALRVRSYEAPSPGGAHALVEERISERPADVPPVTAPRAAAQGA
jgi:proteasome lid subunit RPN8/RPN11